MKKAKATFTDYLILVGCYCLTFVKFHKVVYEEDVNCSFISKLILYFWYYPYFSG